jgi:putative acetyltransferase
MKRMFTLPEYRGKGIASKVLTELESWAKEENYKIALLRNGSFAKRCYHLYQKSGYEVIENFGQYHRC